MYDYLLLQFNLDVAFEARGDQGVPAETDSVIGRFQCIFVVDNKESADRVEMRKDGVGYAFYKQDIASAVYSILTLLRPLVSFKTSDNGTTPDEVLQGLRKSFIGTPPSGAVESA